MWFSVLDTHGQLALLLAIFSDSLLFFSSFSLHQQKYTWGKLVVSHSVVSGSVHELRFNDLDKNIV